jgi:PAS domain S-box-containing protein
MGEEFTWGETTATDENGQALSAKGLRFRTLFESLPFGMVLIDEDGTFKYINPKFKELFGYDLMDVPNGRNWFRKAYPDLAYRRQVIAAWLDDLKGSNPGERRPREFFVTCKDGRQKICQLISVLFDTRENLLVCLDITEQRRAEQALRESEEKYSAVVNQAKDGVVLIQDNIIQFVNKASADTVGYTVDEMQNTPYINYVAPESRAMVAARVEARLAGEEVPEVYEARILHKDGTVIDAELSANVIQYAGKRTDVGIIRNITERKRAEEMIGTQHDLILALSAPQTLEEGLRLCINAALRISKMDCGGVYLIDGTTGALKLVFHQGLSPEFGKAVSHYDADSDNARLVMAGKAVYSEFAALGVPLDEVQAKENLGAIAVLPVHHNGRVVGSLHVASHTLREVPTFCRVTLESIAGQIGSSIVRLNMEEALRKSEERFRHSMEATSDGLWDWVISTDGGYFSPGCYRMLGYKPNAFPMTGREWLNRMHPEDRERTLRANRACIKNRQDSFESEFRMKTKNGDWKWILGRGKAVSRDAEGRALRMIGTHVDITERKLASERLRNSREQLRALSARLQNIREEERTLMAREIHDELGQSLTALKMDLSWLAKRFSKDQKTWLEKAKSMSGLIDSTIRSVRRIATQLRPGILDDLGLTAAIEWQGQEFQERTGIACIVRSSQEHFDLDEVSTTAIFRIFQETLTNVARHSKASRVNVSLCERQGRVILKVQDDGRGVTASKLSSPKSLGLLGMKERALLLGGELKINGVRRKGTTVTVCIPMKRSHSVETL